MAKINPCLKRTFTVFNVFFAIVGAAILLLALISQVATNVNTENVRERTTGLVVLYVFGTITLLIAILGAYGAHKESKVCLIVFLVCMVIGSLVMLRTGVPAAVVRPQLDGILKEKFSVLLPLDQASSDVQDMANTLQTQLQCCGLFSYTDWRKNIPNSCLCNQQVEGDQCQLVKVDYLGYRSDVKYVYSKTCFPIISHYALLFADIVIGVVFFLAVLALLGMILSSIMIHQLRYTDRPMVLMTVPTIFTDSPPKYQELQNPPKY